MHCYSVTQPHHHVVQSMCIYQYTQQYDVYSTTVFSIYQYTGIPAGIRRTTFLLYLFFYHHQQQRNIRGNSTAETPKQPRTQKKRFRFLPVLGKETHTGTLGTQERTREPGNLGTWEPGNTAGEEEMRKTQQKAAATTQQRAEKYVVAT